jgi:hypothetical protein
MRSMVNDPEATPLGKIVRGRPVVVTASTFHSLVAPSGRRRTIVPLARSAICSSFELDTYESVTGLR